MYQLVTCMSKQSMYNLMFFLFHFLHARFPVGSFAIQSIIMSATSQFSTKTHLMEVWSSKKKKKKSLITLIKWILINVFVLNYYFPPFSSRPRTSSVLWGRKDLRWGSCRKPLRPLSRTCDGWRRTWTRSSAGCSARRRYDSSSLVPLTPSGDVTGHMQVWVILPWQQPEP